MTGPVPSTEPPARGSGPEVDNPKRAIVSGTVGSVMMLAGSLGVGWLPAVSDLSRWPLFIFLRLNPFGVVLCVVLLAAGAMLLVRSWLRLGQQVRVWGRQARRATLTAVAAWGAPMMLAIPLFSRDVYAYMVQGQMVLNGLNPYEEGYSQVSNWFSTGADKLWAQSPTPYGPLFLWVEEWVAWLSGGQQMLSILLFRLVALAGVALCIVYVPKLARLHGINPHRALWLSAANPLFLINFIAAVHNDALMLGLALAGLYHTAVRRPVLGILLVSLSIAVKPVTIIFLPFIGLLWAGRRAGWGRKSLYWALTACASFAVLALLGALNGYGFGWVGAMSTPVTLWIWYAPVGIAGWIVATLFSAFGLNGWVFGNVVHLLGLAAAGVIIVLLALKGSYQRIIRRLAIALGALVLLSPMIQSWYVVWLIPLFAVTGIRTDWQVKTLYFLVSFFMIYSVSDQLDITWFIDLNLLVARCVAAVVAVGFGLYLVFIDPKTKALFLRKLEDPQSTPQI
ncbi:polyprenol phosphomannose-dependent alpha 1,6 mannosyltransferase MptB [Arthrobacter castelli]|uniref:polyprenol phosphomannose-dependent alpha 1,6 mannosyltransferase MptB n=1 Tax=Arthrobacter castelli TaxID=271431 RepID=UPI000564D46A|nr:polyprenol phosphomannose-dependent alpha 1,6 mannosyltransferase MptB [Arthrobacter castelli]